MIESDFSSFALATAEKEVARERYNSASYSLQTAQIKHRLAEIKSQNEPLASLIDKQLSERERLYAAAFYVVVGRMP